MRTIIGFTSLFATAILLATVLPVSKVSAQNMQSEQDAGTDPVAERMLTYQRSYGGWPKAIGGDKVDYAKPISDDERAAIRRTSDDEDATIDNKATTREIAYLMKAYGQTKNIRYLEAARSGIDYLFKAQYDNGGWPQYYPNKKLYRHQITFNDDAIINVLNIMLDIANKAGDYAVLGEDYVRKAKQSVDKGISCILKTQVIVDGHPTVWAAQYDEKALLPATARAYELPALASSESANIVRFLMHIEQPAPELKAAITSAVQWFDQVKIAGYKTERIGATDDDKKGKDVVLVADPSSTIWARFYDLQTMKPMFVGRDGQPKATLAEIDNERRTGYAWYGNWGAKLPKEYAKWQKVNGMN